MIEATSYRATIVNIMNMYWIDSEFSEIVLETLPETAKGFVEMIGLKPTLALVFTFGGAEIRFIKNINSWRFEKVASVIGHEAAVKLAEEFNGCESVYIPRCDKTRKKLRNQQIIIEFDKMTTTEGISCRDAANDLAIKHGISNRMVENIVNS